MKKTEQYDLNQWELSDRIRMEDFNADNAKIAAALAGKMGTWELVKTRDIKGSLNHSGPFLEIQNWEPYNFVAIFFDIQVLSLNSSSTFVWTLCKAGGLMDDYKYTTSPGSVIFLFFPMQSSDNLVKGIFIGPGTANVITVNLPFRDFSGYSFTGRSIAGTEIRTVMTVYAMR